MCSFSFSTVIFSWTVLLLWYVAQTTDLCLHGLKTKQFFPPSLLLFTAEVDLKGEIDKEGEL